MSRERVETFEFVAHDKSGKEFLLEARTLCEGDNPKVTTVYGPEGQDVDRNAKGKYTLFDNAEEIELTSDDPNAP